MSRRRGRKKPEWHAEAIRLFKTGLSFTAIGPMVGRTISAVSRAVHGRNDKPLAQPSRVYEVLGPAMIFERHVTRQVKTLYDPETTKMALQLYVQGSIDRIAMLRMIDGTRA